MERSINKSLEDILKMIEEIDSFFGPGERRFDYYMSNTCLQRAIQMNIAIIGEATNRILKINPEIDISSAKKIVATRNFLIHGYDTLSHDIIWGIVIKYLPLLRQEVRALLEK